MAARNVTGHVRLVKRDRGPKWYAKYRLPDGRQVQKMLGPAWTERGRPPEGYYIERTAKEALGAILADARRGTLQGMRQTGVTFADAAAEFVRFKGEVRRVDTATVGDFAA
jgi:integrase